MIVGVYNISGIILEFTPLFSDYFALRLSHFTTSELTQPARVMKTRILPIESIPQDTPYFSHLSKVMFREGNRNVLYLYSDASRSQLMQKITYDQDYKEVDIIMSPDYKDRLPEIEYLTTAMFFFEMAIREGKYPLHGSAINYHGEAIIFSAPSGIGKSTHASLWMTYLEGVIPINDDKPILSFIGDKLYASGTPWSGKTDLTNNLNLPVKAIVFLSQGRDPKILSMSSSEKIVALLKNGFRSREENTQDTVLRFIHQILSTNVDITGYETNVSASAFKTIYDFLYQEDVNED